MAKKSTYNVTLTTWSLSGTKATSEIMFTTKELVKALPVFTTLERECHYGQVTLYRDGVEFATGKAPE
jgi:hypothetical protein